MIQAVFDADHETCGCRRIHVVPTHLHPHLATVIDCHSKMVVGWAMADQPPGVGASGGGRNRQR
ncbi:hypothetical protein [Actinomadura sp. NAK00032]|uniref:hypothetical protein n=1 Tax=Actinomadura sp. NAK00032 TaxID=2742128 RepID=UPI001C37B8D3|nr:hypothetical protein [Actinomadura sp. NAK00032]